MHLLEGFQQKISRSKNDATISQDALPQPMILTPAGFLSGVSCLSLLHGKDIVLPFISSFYNVQVKVEI